MKVYTDCQCLGGWRREQQTLENLTHSITPYPTWESQDLTVAVVLDSFVMYYLSNTFTFLIKYVFILIKNKTN